MNPFDEYIVNSLKFSHSSLTSFSNCRYGWKLNYIDSEDGVKNAFAEFGLIVHQTLEKYFRKEIGREQLYQYYVNNYHSVVVDDFPIFPRGMGQRYYNDGLEFFQDVPVDSNKYEVIILEDGIEGDFEESKIIVKPDLVAKNLETGEVELLDYKTSKPVKPKSGDWDLKKMDDYFRQMILYKYFIEKVRGVHIDRIKLIFVRVKKIYEVEVTEEKTKELLGWLHKTIAEIKLEDDFEANPTSKYFCDNLCSMREICQYRDRS